MNWAMQPQDTTALRAVVNELQTQLVPARFEKAQQPASTWVQLGFRTLTQRLWLDLHWQADAARFHAIPAPPRQGEGSTLAQQLQHGLAGLALVRLEQPPWERVVQLGFAERPGAVEQRRLVLELMGRHSNLFLLDHQDQVIATGRQVRDHQSRWRPIGTGDSYGPPPPLQGAIASATEAEQRWRQRLCLVPEPIAAALLHSYRGLSPALRDQLLEAAEVAPECSTDSLSPSQWQQLHSAWLQWLNALEQGAMHFQPWRDGYRCWQPQPPGAQQPAAQKPAAPTDLALNLALASYYDEGLRRQRCQRRRSQLQQHLQQLIKREQRDWQQQQQLMQRSEGEALLQRQADLLLCRPDVASSGHQRLLLQDPCGGPELAVELNPQLSLVVQAQKLYQKARKLRRSVAAIEPRLRLHHNRLELLENSLLQLELADSEDEALLDALEEDLAPFLQKRAPGRRQAKREVNEPQPLCVNVPGGLRLLVGRNHRQNDWISFRQARRGDLWFHAQEQPGSHVVLKGSEGDAGDADYQAAADLAAHFSRSRGNRRVPVVMVPVEQLQRIPGMAAGLVRHGGGSILWGEPERALTLLPSLQQ
jgi:predicted ribosome quality control (RQC) complex YloA/Tae2 family protein